MSISPDTKTARDASIASLALERIVRSPAALVENLPIGIYTCDRDGLLVQFNRRAAQLWGRTPALGEAMAPDESAMAQVLRTGQPVRDREVLVAREAGESLTVLANVDPLFDEHGTLVGGIDCFQDITELTRMKLQVREGRRLGRRVMEALPAAIYTTDAQGKLLYFNKAAENLWGFAPPLGEQAWCGSWKILLPDGTPLPHDQCPMAVALREKRALVGPEAVAERPDGGRVPFMPYPTPIFDSQGELIGGVNMLIDLSAQKRADAQQRGLIDELNHRVKNTLATIQSLAAQTMRGSTEPGDRAFESRLLALSRVHDQLTRHAWEWADFAIIAQQSFVPLRGSANSAVKLHGPSVRLQPKAALALAMVLHELAANAGRHGALSTPAGSVSLDWRVDGKRLLVDWRERGGPAVAPPAKRGFGTRLLERSVAEELRGAAQLDYAAAGVHCTMEIPLPE
ncbi:MAG TPA: HWE histidine kinase domain-containing protein [Rhizomicrobium sp.]|jgi:PAS domain S-box-containing protein|nr:HWE histidine kinase domain-containing protein [Rhizomicrobium sp.]